MMNRLDWIDTALQFLRQEGKAVLVTQCLVEGSAPREAGTKMLVSASRQAGTIGGGNLEHQAIAQAHRLLEREDISHLLQDYPLGPLLRQCCGGHVRLMLERLGESDQGWLADLSGSASGGYVLETRFDQPGPRKCLHPPDVFGSVETVAFIGEDGCPLQHARPARALCKGFVERVAAAPVPVMLYGAGHVGKAIAHVLSISDHPITWFDSRRDYLEPKSGLDIHLLDKPEAQAAAAPPEAVHLVLTHNHDLDYRLVRAILTRGDFILCGLIGSKTKRTRFIRRLQADGLPAEAIARLTCPIGLPEISGKAPSTIAVAVAGQLIQLASARAFRSPSGRQQALQLQTAQMEHEHE